MSRLGLSGDNSGLNGEAVPAEVRAYRIVYEEAVRSLDIQRAVLDALRTRVGFLLSAATIATSFLGGLALRDATGAGTWIAIGLFATFAGIALSILWPRAEGPEGYTASASDTLDGYVEGPDGLSLPHMLRNLALYAEVQLKWNQERHLDVLVGRFRAAIVVLSLEVTAWVVDLALR